MLTIYDPVNGLGALQLSVYFPADALGDLKEELKEHLDNEYIEVKDMGSYAYGNFLDSDNIFWRYWLHQLENNTLIFSTYSCEQADRSKEDEEIDRLVKSIALD